MQQNKDDNNSTDNINCQKNDNNLIHNNVSNNDKQKKQQSSTQPNTNINNAQIQTIFYYQSRVPVLTKVYVGQLPLDITQQNLSNAFKDYCQINQIKIVKKNYQGNFTKYCFAFLNIKGNQNFSNQAIKNVSQKNPTWKINLKSDYQKIQNKNKIESQNNAINFIMQKQQQLQQQQLQQQKMQNAIFYPGQFDNPNTINTFIKTVSTQNINYNDQQKSTKNIKILVRQIWIGGIPEGITQSQMRSIMSYFGVVQAIQIISKYAFIKFKLVNDATAAFQKAAIIHQKFGHPAGFRIFFSDPQKRPNIVSNNYQFDRQSQFSPVLFLGFPPFTSSFVDETYMSSICSKYGTIVNTYSRRNTNPQRSYVLLTYNNVKSAQRAKKQLSKRKDLLGDKKVQIKLLLAQQPILKGRNLQQTIQKYQSQNNLQKKPTKIQNNLTFSSVPVQNMYMSYNYPPFQNNNLIAPIPIQQINPNYYPMMMDPRINYGYQGGPLTAEPLSYGGQQQLTKLINSSFINQNHNNNKTIQKSQKPQYIWSGYLYRQNNIRVQIQGYSKTKNIQLNLLTINIQLLIKIKDLKLKQKKQIMIIQSHNQSQKRLFNQYINFLKNKQSAGISLLNQQILFILPKCDQTDIIQQIKQNQLLIIMEDITLYHQLKNQFFQVHNDN